MDTLNNSKDKGILQAILCKLRERRASVSVEALFVLPIFIFFMVLLIFTLRFLAIDDSFNQCLYESTIEFSNLESSSSDIINSAVLNMLLKKNLAQMDLDLDSILLASSHDNILEIKAFYLLDTPFSKPLKFSESLIIYKETKELETYVYVTPHGKKYHYEDCILTKGRGVRVNIKDISKDLEACKNCILGNRYFKKKAS